MLDFVAIFGTKKMGYERQWNGEVMDENGKRKGRTDIRCCFKITGQEQPK